MTAARHVAPEQLAMFMTARELHGPGIASSDFAHYKVTPKVGWQRKLERSKVAEDDRDKASVAMAAAGRGAPLQPQPGSVYADVAKHGVLEPVHLAHETGPRGAQYTYLGQGHHRVAAQFDIDPDRMIPVQHHKTREEAVMPGGARAFFEQNWGARVKT